MARPIAYDVTVDLSDLAAGVRAQVLQEVHAVCKDIAHRAHPVVVDSVGRHMRASKEYASLASGRLREEFGLGTLAGGPVDGLTAAESVVLAVQKRVRVAELPPDGDAAGGVEVAVFRADFGDAKEAAWAEYQSKAGPIPWLEWLLFEGTGTILNEHNLLKAYPARGEVNRKASRTGKTIMVKYDFVSTAVRKGSTVLNPKAYHAAHGRTKGWGVPAEFAGDSSDNWLTRVAAAVAPDVIAFLDAEAAKYGLG